MAYHWIPPPPGVLKINVHDTSSRSPSLFGIRTGIGAVYRDSDEILKHLTIGVIPPLSTLGNQLWAIFIALRRAFKMGYRDVILETDNLEAFLVIKNFHIGAPPGVFHIASHIDIRLRDVRWYCTIAYVVPARNKVARFISRLGKRVCDFLFTCNRPVGGVEELLDFDMGMGIDDPSYQDNVIPDGAPNPVSFDGGELPSDRIELMGLGQINAPTYVGLDREMDIDNNLEGVMAEEAVHGGIAANRGMVFMGDTPLVEVD